MIRRPPRSTLFPTRRSSDLGFAPTFRMRSGAFSSTIASSSSKRWRSEEHTSELQSQSNLVCRLLLEKKKKEFENDLRRLADDTPACHDCHLNCLTHSHIPQP